MTWRRGTITDHPGGKARDGVEITCDATGCHRSEVLGAHGGSVEKIQRLLMKRGWVWTQVVDGGRDFCPDHATEPACCPPAYHELGVHAPPQLRQVTSHG